MERANEKKYKICFFVFGELRTIAEEVIREINTPNVEFVLIDSMLENLEDCVKEARELGCRVFIAGPGNAAKFSTLYDYPLVRISIQYIDYALAIRAVKARGYDRVVLPRHRDSPALEVKMLQQLLDVQVMELVYEGLYELYDQIRVCECEAVVGAGAAVEAAERCGKYGRSVYSGKASIRDACLRAASLAQSLYESQKNRQIINSLLGNSQFALIFTDERGGCRSVTAQHRNTPGFYQPGE